MAGNTWQQYSLERSYGTARSKVVVDLAGQLLPLAL